MPKKLDFTNLRLCIDNYPLDFIFIRDCGGIREDGKYSCQGMSKVSENLEGRTLDFKKGDGLHILIDDSEVFHFPKNDRYKGFSLAYERVEKDGSLVMLSTGIDPYDSKLPEPRMSFLRNIIDYHLIEIYFKGRIDLEFHSWWIKPLWKYWTVIRPLNK